jgi:hypothetical protein
MSGFYDDEELAKQQAMESQSGAVNADIQPPPPSSEEMVRDYIKRAHRMTDKSSMQLADAEERASKNQMADGLINAGNTAAYAIAGLPEKKLELGDNTQPLKQWERRSGIENKQEQLIKDFILSKYKGDQANAQRKASEEWKQINYTTAADQRKFMNDMATENKNFRQSEAAERKAYQRSQDAIRHEEKAVAAQAKDKKLLTETEDRRQNIINNISELERMIADKGTYEMLGSHNQNLDRLVDQVATDMAKLQDPESVARPGEVELVKQGLVQSGFKNSNKTALDILKKFKGEVEGRAKTAYEVRGAKPPAAYSAAVGPSEEIISKVMANPNNKGKSREQIVSALKKAGAIK